MKAQSSALHPAVDEPGGCHAVHGGPASLWGGGATDREKAPPKTHWLGAEKPKATRHNAERLENKHSMDLLRERWPQ